jgi:hypothetical protein
VYVRANTQPKKDELEHEASLPEDEELRLS